MGRFRARWKDRYELDEPSEDESDVSATIGISEFASTQLGDVVFVELPEVGLEVKKSDMVGAVESVKSASDIYAPVSGKIIETNPVLEDKPGSINQSPEKDAWLAKMEITNPAEVEALMTKEEYDALEK